MAVSTDQGLDLNMSWSRNTEILNQQMYPYKYTHTQIMHGLFVADLTSELNVTDDAGDGCSTAPEALTNIEASLQSKVEVIRSQSTTVARECQQLKEELTRAQREHKTLKEQRQSHKDARTAVLPKARYRNSVISQDGDKCTGEFPSAYINHLELSCNQL